MINWTSPNFYSECADSFHSYSRVEEAGCAPLSSKAENEAALVLKKMNKKEYAIGDLFLALFAAAEKHWEQLDTESFRKTIPTPDLKTIYKIEA